MRSPARDAPPQRKPWKTPILQGFIRMYSMCVWRMEVWFATRRRHQKKTPGQPHLPHSCMHEVIQFQAANGKSSFSYQDIS